ncbi:GNAT family N-acetyltransferase [Vulgatibacter incomptus]|uniref:GNAT family acetyltransferase YhhY n=1 Tax=Vulgatibacter incomptus TaxID=1391653 RepID=A0A0K1PJF8_9BACT|nr:GNAT family N-acetyltransferase [Vulgatibacter incomptus]AKU93219.1 GNAT family acetyltransferase YhhY [Vulgatibacter incomptus]
MRASRHVLTIFAVNHLPRAVRFYDLAFGWEKSVNEPAYVEYTLPEGRRVGLYDRVAFGRNTGRIPAAVAEGEIAPCELYLHVDDPEPALRSLAQAGARPLSGLEPRPWGDEAAYFADPDGNVIVVARPLLRSAGPDPETPIVRDAIASAQRDGHRQSSGSGPIQFTIRRAEPEDFAAVRAIYASPRAQADTLQLPFPSLDLWRQRMQAVDPHMHFLVACAGDDVVGQLGLHASSRPRRLHVGELGMGVRDDWQGRGVGTALLRAALDLADRWLQLRRIELQVYADNAAAIALYRRHGFVLEGTHRDFAFRDGAYVDALSMGRLRPEGATTPEAAPTPGRTE